MDAADAAATTPEAYLQRTVDWRMDLYSVEPATLMTHAKSITLFHSLGTKFTPELKAPSVEMPFNGFIQADYAQILVVEYRAADISPSDVWLQS